MAKPKARQAVAEWQASARDKLSAIAAEIAEVDPDLLFVCEGPAGEDRALR
jgi:hypothetical protein